MPPTAALSSFKSSLELALALMKIERDSYADPPLPNEISAVLGLRGGAAVLMVAAFERFINDLCPEALQPLVAVPVTFGKLPDKVQVRSVFGTLSSALDGPRFGPKGLKVDRLPAILIAGQQVLSQTVNPGVFGETGGNPNSEALKEIFGDAGIADLFNTIKLPFEKRWNSPTNDRFIKDTLDSILDRRHLVAHKADALAISRRDLRDAVRFLRSLGETLDQVLRASVRTQARVAK